MDRFNYPVRLGKPPAQASIALAAIEMSTLAVIRGNHPLLFPRPFKRCLSNSRITGVTATLCITIELRTTKQTVDQSSWGCSNFACPSANAI